MSDIEQAQSSQPLGEKSLLAKMLAGDYGLATTYWACPLYTSDAADDLPRLILTVTSFHN